MTYNSCFESFLILVMFWISKSSTLISKVYFVLILFVSILLCSLLDSFLAMFLFIVILTNGISFTYKLVIFLCVDPYLVDVDV